MLLLHLIQYISVNTFISNVRINIRHKHGINGHTLPTILIIQRWRASNFCNTSNLAQKILFHLIWEFLYIKNKYFLRETTGISKDEDLASLLRFDAYSVHIYSKYVNSTD